MDHDTFEPIPTECEKCGKVSEEVAAAICLDCMYDNENMDRMYQYCMEMQDAKNDRLERF